MSLTLLNNGHVQRFFLLWDGCCHLHLLPSYPGGDKRRREASDEMIFLPLSPSRLSKHAHAGDVKAVRVRTGTGAIMRVCVCVCVCACVRACRGCGLSSSNTPIKRRAGAWSRELGMERESARLGRRVASALKPARAPQFSHSSRAARDRNDPRVLFSPVCVTIRFSSVN
uniref:Uncharacterized protein n=1 Tax=Takifugu rubripes TaxID=31033 RepID=A0A674NN77_TAKRU